MNKIQKTRFSFALSTSFLVALCALTLFPAASVTRPELKPNGDLNNWKLIFSEDFLTPVNEGYFPGSSYSSKWGVYPDGTKDTSANNFGTNSRYYPSKVVSVKDGILTKRLHTETINGKPTALVATLTPLLPGTQAYDKNKFSGWPDLRGTSTSTRYGRYSIRFRADSVAGFKTAWLLWPESEVWPRDGEIDFPEGNLDSKICSFLHRQGATQGGDQDASCANQYFNQWHTATIERTPTYVAFLLDGLEISRSTNRLPNSNMNWRIQTETCFPNCQPASNAIANVQIDWVTVHAWDPTAREMSPSTTVSTTTQTIATQRPTTTTRPVTTTTRPVTTTTRPVTTTTRPVTTTTRPVTTTTTPAPDARLSLAVNKMIRDFNLEKVDIYKWNNPIAVGRVFFKSNSFIRLVVDFTVSIDSQGNYLFTMLDMKFLSSSKRTVPQ